VTPQKVAAAGKPTVTRTRAVATVSMTLRLKRAARLRARALDWRGRQQLILLSGSRLGKVVSRRDAYAISARARAGKVTLRLRLARTQLAPGRSFRILVDTMGSRGVIATSRVNVKAP